MISARFRMALSVVLVVVFIGLALWYMDAHRAELRRLRLVNGGLAFGVGFLFLCNLALRGMFLLYVMRAFSIRLNALEAFGLSAATTMANFLLPLRGGAIIRAHYLKRRHGLPYLSFASSLLALYVLSICVATGMGLAAALVLALTDGVWSLSVLILLASIFAVSGLSIFFSPTLSETQNPVLRYLRRLSEGWDTIRRSKAVLVATTCTVVGATGCSIAGFYLAFAMFSIERSVLGCVLLSSSQQIGALIGLTPGALGFQEIAGMYFARVLPATELETFTVLASVRIIMVSVSVVLGLPALMLLTHQRSRHPVTNTAEVSHEQQ